ncbi:MAG: hypothetical protein PHE79_11220 [Eubacteriales bacterium]|nr:hypothetical protein [Eubacteriales bacterium]
MTKFIALACVLPLLAFFILQYSLDIKNSHIKGNAETIVVAACEQAKQEGCFTPEIIESMKMEFEKAGIDSDKVIIGDGTTTTPKYRTDEFDSREMIDYKIGVPIDNIFAAQSFFGLTDEENSYIKYYFGKLASERLNE